MQLLVDILPLDSNPDPGSRNVADPTNPDPKRCTKLIMMNANVMQGLHEGVVAALKGLELLPGFWSAPRILELLPGFWSKM